jgi:transcription-repair coupling factor (superfamily II helicase)
MALKPGDYVVHVDHGIGIYRGTRRLAVDGHETDCIEIHYQRGDKLFIPADQFDLVQKYALEEGQRAPGVSRLGGAAWMRTKEKAKQAIQDMAEELLKLGALRSSRPGFAFSPDTVWQRHLESSFIYDDTPDQVRATEEIKRDMEMPRPMDRLVCGDVGYGKTEVAVRAAFKAVQDGKQVAVLVPTTILAQQHHATFSERLLDFPPRVEVLSRFRTAAEQREVVAGLKSGTVDIVIGTHRLLQKDIAFRDLGLIIVDEEHRFGVKHKERLKQLKAMADILTLTATPIPRTLHLSISGARDISLINTPPRDRVPIHTEISEFDRDLIADVLLREADRGGQSFFVHNRVQSIEAMVGLLRRLCPQLRFAVAHGQMHERALERVIVEFMERKHDVLVTTMIIESGVDMPSVNTMIVNRADRFGLAQLYQLRGRVGRSNQRAHCYLLVPPHRALTEAAERRLRVIEEYEELGSGLKVAMKDLEIRGAGNLLGAQQHGHILSVGFDLYCRLLEETVAELKGEEPVERTEARVVTELEAYLPDDYVGSPVEKITFYKRLADSRDAAQVSAIEEELADRFGRLPDPARNLLFLRRIKLGAAAAGLVQVDIGRRRVRFDFARPPTKAEMQTFLARCQVKLEFVYGERFSMTAREVAERPLELTIEVLEALAEAPPGAAAARRPPAAGPGTAAAGPAAASPPAASPPEARPGTVRPATVRTVAPASSKGD